MKQLLLLSLVVLKMQADIQELDLSHENSFNSNQVSNSEIVQGSLEMEDSILNNSHINTRNTVRYTNLEDDSLIEQSSIKLFNGSKIENSEIDLISDIAYSNIESNSSVIQNSILLDDSLMDASTIMSSSVVENIQVKDSMIRQSSVDLRNGSSVENGSSFTFNNVIENINIEKSLLSQSELFINDSTLNNVDIVSSNFLSSNQGELTMENALVMQGLHRIERSSLMNSHIKTDTAIVDTTITDAVLDMCGASIQGSTLSSVNIDKYCSMQKSKISNGAVLYQGMTRVN